MWGVAYKIPRKEIINTKNHLDDREKGGYETVSVMFHPKNERHNCFNLDIYIGTAENPFYLGPADLKEMAHQIYHAVGPSGPNTEYLFQLAWAMQELVPHIEDKHLKELEHAVRDLCDQGKTV